MTNRPAVAPRISPWGRKILTLTAPLGVIAFWVGMVIAAWRYPTEYDWRYLTISSLVFPDRNPGGHLWASVGIVLCGLGQLCWASALRGARTGTGARAFGVRAVLVGGGSMACCAALPERLVSVPRTHEVLALTAFFSLCLGLTYLTYQTMQPHLRRSGFRVCTRLWAGVLAGAAMSPIVLAAVAQTYVSNVLPELPWVNLTWRARGIPVYLSFAFWEWVTCATFSVYLFALPLVQVFERHRSTAAS